MEIVSIPWGFEQVHAQVVSRSSRHTTVKTPFGNFVQVANDKVVECPGVTPIHDRGELIGVQLGPVAQPECPYCEGTGVDGIH